MKTCKSKKEMKDILVFQENILTTDIVSGNLAEFWYKCSINVYT